MGGGGGGGGGYGGNGVDVGEWCVCVLCGESIVVIIVARGH